MARIFCGILERFAQRCHQEKIDLAGFSAFLGPHLRSNNFEVRKDFIDQIPASKKTFLQERNGTSYYDMTSGVVRTLESFGISTLEDCGIDTFNNPDYFSYRSWTKLPPTERSRPLQYFCELYYTVLAVRNLNAFPTQILVVPLSSDPPSLVSAQVVFGLRLFPFSRR